MKTIYTVEYYPRYGLCCILHSKGISLNKASIVSLVLEECNIPHRIVEFISGKPIKLFKLSK